MCEALLYVAALFNVVFSRQLVRICKYSHRAHVVVEICHSLLHPDLILDI